MSVTNALTGTESQTNLQTRKITLEAADIKALKATPVELVPAPGAGKVLEFVGAVWFLDAGSEGLTETADNLGIEYDGGSAAAVAATVEMTGFIDQTADTMIRAVANDGGVDAAADVVNKNLALVNNGDGEFAGNASNDAKLIGFVTYRTHETGL